MNTNMNKLGFKLFHIEGGTNEPLEVNASPEWVSKIGENRAEVGEVAKSSPNTRILFLKSIATGSLIGVARALTLTDRGLGCVVGWIYIPYDLIISGQEINGVVDFVSENITSARIDGEAFRREFSKTYGVKQEKGMFLGAEEKSAKAFRYYGRGTKYTLTEILGKLNQPYYRRYNLVVLLDNESGVRVTGMDITNAPLVDVHVMTPPTETCGFTPYVAGQPFVNPIFVSSNEQVQITLRKVGYKDITKTLSATDRLVITAQDTMRVVEMGSIKVWDEATRRPVENCVVSLNGHPLPVYISDAERRQVQIKVDAPGYHTYRGTYDLDRSNGILLKKAERIYIFQLRLKNGKECRFSIPTMDDFYEVPFPGYTSNNPIREGVINKLEYKPSNGGWRRAIVVGAAALIVGILLGVGVSSLFGNDEQEKQKTEQVKNQGKQNQGKQNQGKQNQEDGDTSNSSEEDKKNNLEDAIAYLDSHNKWQKDEMEKFEVLKGLHGYLCEYKFTKIIEYKEKLADSDTFMEIVKVVELAHKKDIPENGKYDGEDGITVSTYITAVQRKIHIPSPPPGNTGGNTRGNNRANSGGNNSSNSPDLATMKDKF